MFRVIAQITAIVLAIMTGSAIGDSTHSGVAGFVIGLIAWLFLAWLLGVIGSVLDAIPGAVYDSISGRDEPRPRTYYAGTQEDAIAAYKARQAGQTPPPLSVRQPGPTARKSREQVAKEYWDRVRGTHRTEQSD